MLLSYTRRAYSLIGKPPIALRSGRGRATPRGQWMAERKSVPKQEDRTFVRKRTTKITIIEPRRAALGMAKSKTGSFWLTETVTIAAGDTSGAGTLDLGAYVDVGDQQALSVEQVEVIWQVHNTVADVYNSFFAPVWAADNALDIQLTDLNPSAAIVRADDNSLIASAAMQFDDTNNVISFGPDLYPDTFGKLDESRMVVNDQMYVSARTAITPVAGYNLEATVRVKARIVKLSTKDWMAIAIQSTAADN